MVKIFGSYKVYDMTVLYLNMCHNKVYYKGTAPPKNIFCQDQN